MISFTKDLETGITQIDMQHIELINRLNNVVASGVASVTKEETEKTLDFLEAYIEKHFGDEEVLQMQSNYPKYSAHRALHNGFKQEFKKLRMEYQYNGPSAAFTLQLNKAIIEWIIKHIKYTDSEFAKYYLAQNR